MSSTGYKRSDLDGEQSARAMDVGASSGLKHTDLTDPIHEDAKPGRHALPGVGEKTSAAGLEGGHDGGSKPLFDARGAIGKQFTPQGAVGGVAQALGGPLDKDGLVGRQFTEKGSVGGTVQGILGEGKK